MAHAPGKNGRKPTAAQDAARLANLAKGKGRPKGTPNKVTRAVRELAAGLVEDPAYLASLKQRLEEGKAGAMEPVVWYFAYGKPKESVELSGSVQSVFQVTGPDGAPLLGIRRG